MGATLSLVSRWLSAMVFACSWVAVAADLRPTDVERMRLTLDAGRYRAAEFQAAAWLESREEDAEPDAPPLGEALHVLVDARLAQGWWPTDLDRTRLQRALRIKRRAYGSDHLEVARTMHLLGVLQRKRGELEEARRWFESAIRRVDEHGASEDVFAARIQASFAFVKHDEGRGSEAIVDLEEAVAVLDESMGPSHPRAVVALCGLAYLLGYQAGELDRAIALLEPRLALVRRTHGATHPLVARILVGLGNLQLNDQRLEQARRAYDEAATIIEATYDAGHPYAVDARFGTACVHRKTGEYTKARGLFERVAHELEAIRGPDDPKIGSVLFSLGRLHRLTGEYSEARRVYARALEINENHYGIEHQVVGLVLTRLGLLLADLGDLGEAESVSRRALRIFENAEPRHPWLIAQPLGIIGMITLREGRLGETKSVVERILRLAEEADVPTDNPALIATHSLMANVAVEEGELTEARRRFEEDVEARERAFGPEHPYVATALHGLAEVAAQMGDVEHAIRSVERAITIRQNALGPDDLRVGASSALLARALARAGRGEAALAASLRAERLMRAKKRVIVRSLPERQALDFVQSKDRALDVALTLIARGDTTRDVVTSVWGEWIRSRAVVLDEMVRRRRTVVRSANAEIEALDRELAAARESLANLVIRGAGTLSPEVYRRLVASARERKEQAEWTLANRCSSHRDPGFSGDVGWREVSAKLPEGSAVVSYVKYRSAALLRETTEWSGADADAEPTVDPPEWRYLAFVSGPDGSGPDVVDLGPAQTIERPIEAWRDEARSLPGALVSEFTASERRCREAGERLRRVVWDPVARFVDGAKLVIVVPDGALHFVHLAALPRKEGGFLVEGRPELHHVSAERDVAVMDKSLSEESLLALGGADFDACSSSRASDEERSGTRWSGATTESRLQGANRADGTRPSDQGRLRFAPLRGSAREVAEIANIWRRESPVAEGRDARVVTLLGRHASETELERLAPHFGILHLATHGFVGRARLEASRDDLRTPRPGSRPTAHEHPLLVSGIALAGANCDLEERGQRDDGVLTAEEIAKLDLSRVDWAVLSACESGLGDVVDGEGLLGLRRVFRVAGARTLITSLWPVQDEAARQWMRALYAARRSGSSTSGAVREASVRTLRRRRRAGQSTHPIYWGAFVAFGHWE